MTAVTKNRNNLGEDITGVKRENKDATNAKCRKIVMQPALSAEKHATRSNPNAGKQAVVVQCTGKQEVVVEKRGKQEMVVQSARKQAKGLSAGKQATSAEILATTKHRKPKYYMPD